MMQPIKSEVRQMTAEDAARGAVLTQQIGWSQNQDNWARLIEWAGAGSLCIADGDKLVATAIAIYYSPAVSWIGVVITHPDYQRQGLARRMMTAAIDYLRGRGAQCIMLDASKMGYPLYDSMGFRSLYKVEVFQGNAPLIVGSDSVRELTEADIPAVIQRDGQLFGVERPQIIRSLALPGAAWVLGSPDDIQGYLLLKHSRKGASIGPWYHNTSAGAEALLRRALVGINGQGAGIYIPEMNTAAKAIVTSYGMIYDRYCTRMVLGDEPPGDMTHQYSVASLATG
jgi:GNAT superfamily N-acetyltransferase